MDKPCLSETKGKAGRANIKQALKGTLQTLSLKTFLLSSDMLKSPPKKRTQKGQFFSSLNVLALNQLLDFYVQMVMCKKKVG